jgi:hypothetical protein
MTGLTWESEAGSKAGSEAGSEARTTPTGPLDGVATASVTTVHWERAALALLVTVVTFGLAIDTQSHRQSDVIDTFFTQEHALGYAGSTACGVFLLYLVRRRQIAGLRGRDVIPLGLESAIAGLAVYVVGGIGDLSWHTAFGVEQELKILFSPTHLLLMCAMLMLAFGPIRSAWMSLDLDGQNQVQNGRPSLGGMTKFWPLALAAGSMATVLNIFFTYASPFETSVFTVKIPLLFQQFGSFLQVSATLGIFVHTLVFFGIILVMLRRWPLPVGLITVMLAVPAAAMFVYFDWEYRTEITALLVGALAVDMLLFGLQFISSVRLRFRLFGALAPVLFWSLYLVVTKGSDPITWSNEQWTGTIAWSGLLGLALTVLLLPPRLSHQTYLD